MPHRHLPPQPQPWAAIEASGAARVGPGRRGLGMGRQAERDDGEGGREGGRHAGEQGADHTLASQKASSNSGP